MNILDLPTVMLIQIFEHLSYEEVSKKRLVCRKIDQICQHTLNCGFNKVVRQHSISFKRIKALLPRRESERRNHCLARHADILTSIETRISMLSMTYTKYMDLNLCCFIPGRVLDEIIRILRLITKSSKQLRPHEVLQELRDISSMAIEHFDEKIANTLKKSFVENSSKMCISGGGGGGSVGMDSNKLPSPTAGSSLLSFGGLVGSSNSSCSSSNAGNVWNSSGSISPPSTLMNSRCCESIRQRVNALLSLGQTGLLDSIKNPVVDAHASELNSEQQGCPEARATMMYFKKLELEYKKGIVKMHRMQQIQTHQSRRLQQTLSAVAELNVQVVELKKRLEDVDTKNREISANIKQINIGEPPVAVVGATAEAKVDVEAADIDKNLNDSNESDTTITTMLEVEPMESPTSTKCTKRRHVDADNGGNANNGANKIVATPAGSCTESSTGATLVKKPKI